MRKLLEEQYDEILKENMSLRERIRDLEQWFVEASRTRNGLEERVEEYKDAVESLYQIIQRGDLTTLDLTQADEVLDRLKEDMP